MNERLGTRKGARGRKPDAATRVVMAGVAVGAVSQASANPRPVTDPEVLRRSRDLAEALRQTEPLARAGTPAAEQAAKAIRDGTAHRHGLSPKTALRHATRRRVLRDFTKVQNPQGKTAEIVAASDIRDLHRGRDTGMVNPPERVAPNVRDVRVSPDNQASKDLLLIARTPKGDIVVLNGEVKTGAAKYIVREIDRMAATKGRGKVMITDSRFVNPDGSPRVSPDAFTAKQARRIQDAGVELRGVRDLDRRSARLFKDIERYRRDGLDPIKARQLDTLRNDIARAYRPKGMVGRAAGAAAMAAATAAVVTLLVVQAVSEGKIDLITIGEAAGKAAVWGAGGTAADAILYRGANVAGLAPEAAKSFAETGVAAAFCLIAVGADVSEEARAARAGEISTADAVGGSAMKAALDILPLALAPLGLPAIPILIGGQLGGRWVIQRVRDGKMERKWRFAEDMQHIDQLGDRIGCFGDRADRLLADMRRDNAELDETGRLYEEATADGDSR